MMTFQEFLDNPNITAIDFENGYVEFGCSDDDDYLHDETAETATSPVVNLTLTIEQSLYISDLLINASRCSYQADYLFKLFSDATHEAIMANFHAPACLEH